MDSVFPVFSPFAVSDFDDNNDDLFNLSDQFSSVERIEREPSSVVEGVEPNYTIFTPGNGQGSALKAAETTYCATLPMYPRSLADGYAYVVPVRKSATRGTPTKEEVLKMATQFQYSKAAVYSNRPTFSPFLNSHALRYKYSCSGIKHCQYLQPALQTSSHQVVDEDLYRKLRHIRDTVPYSRNTERQAATSMYLGVVSRFEAGACVDRKPSCGPILRQQQRAPLVGNRVWYIGCKSWHWSTKDTESHFIRAVARGVDIDYLQQLFEYGVPTQQQPTEQCNTVESMASRNKKCGVDHPQGQGSMQKTPCSASYHVLIPRDIEAVPYFVLVAFGTHTHIPPPPSITPHDQVQEIISLLQPMLTPGLTRSQFLKSPQLLAYLELHGYQSVEDFSVTFANKDRISRLIQQEKLIQFPYGGGLLGVMFEYKTQHQDPQTAYIQDIVSSVSGNLIICFFDEQVKILHAQNTFQMDMSFKRLQGKWSEILITCFSKDHSKLLTLGRIITDSEGRDMYQKGFTRFFHLASERVGKQFAWRHIHGSGFNGTTVDMDSHQMSGFGRYLTSIDPEKRDWRWQLQSCVRFCHAHFTRSITTACPGVPHIEDSSWGRMRALLNALTPAEYYELLSLLIHEEESPSIKNWAIHKQHIVIAAGLVQCCSLIPPSVWDTLESHSNAAEQAGQKGYRTGKNLPLLEAVTTAQQMDLQDVQEYNARDRFGIRHAYRSPATVSQRYFQNRGREKKRKHNELASQPSFFNDNDEILELSNSSGHVKVPQRKSRTSSRGRSTSRSPSLATSRSSPLPSSTPERTSTPLAPPSLKQQALLSSQTYQNEREMFELKKARFELEKARFELEKEKLEFEKEKRRLLGE